jgi:Protein of unknown function (DUF2635)
MSQTIHIKPAKNQIVRVPETREPLPAYGAAVIDSSYWRRRLSDGDVELMDEAAVKALAKKIEAAEKAAAKAVAEAAEEPQKEEQ